MDNELGDSVPGYSVILKPKCVQKCNAGFKLDSPELYSAPIKSPAFTCKRCGRMWLSAQLDYVSINVWPSKHWRDYEHVAEYLLREER
jgi:ribosomal protein L37E